MTVNTLSLDRVVNELKTRVEQSPEVAKQFYSRFPDWDGTMEAEVIDEIITIYPSKALLSFTHDLISEGVTYWPQGQGASHLQKSRAKAPSGRDLR